MSDITLGNIRDLDREATSIQPPRQTQVPSMAMGWVVWLLSCVFYFYEFLLQVSPSVMAPQISQSFSMTAHSFGVLGGVYFCSYAGMQIPVGILLDRFGPHRLITLATVICAMGTLCFSHTDSFAMALFARFCIGFGSAFAVVGTMKFAANWFPENRFALITGLTIAIGMAGAMGGEKPLAMWVEHAGWRQCLDYLGYAGLVLALLIHLFCKDSPYPEQKTQSSFSDAMSTLFRNLMIVLRNRQLWLIATYGGLVYMGTPVFSGLWGVPFLELKLHLSTSAAASLASMIFLGWIFGSPFWGFVSDRIQRRKPTTIIGALVALIALSSVIYTPTITPQITGYLLFTFGFFSAGFLPIFSIAKEISEEVYTATALSFINMMNMVGIAIVQPAIGYLLDYLWQAQHVGVVTVQRVYELNYYVKALSILPLGLTVALLLTPFIRETYCRSPDQTS